MGNISQRIKDILSDKETIINELLEGGEAEQQLKYAIATNFLMWKKPTVSA
jgi:hypothetical protein